MIWHPLRGAIGGPELVHGVASAGEYRDHARRFLARVGVPPDRWLRPVLPRPAYVSGGCWLVKCDCGNAPSAHPGDGTDAWPEPIAVCLECGALHRPVFPADRALAEAALLERPDPASRNYFPHKDLAALVGEDRAQTVAYLRRENRARGVGGAQ